MTVKTRFSLALPLLLVIAFGCTSSRTPCSVSGKLSYKGQPLGGGTIIFNPTKEDAGGNYGFNINPDGTYTGSSLPAQEYIVTIETESAKEHATPTYGTRGAAGGKDKSGKEAYMEEMKNKAPAGAQSRKPSYVQIPKKYSDKKESPLNAKLKNGRNKLDFDLSD